MKRISLLIIITTFIIINLCQSSQAVIGDFEKGKKAFSGRDYYLSIQYFRRALRSNPTDTKCRYYLAQALIQLKQLEQAQCEYQRIIQSAPYSQEARYAKVALVKLKDYIHNRIFPRWREVNSNMDIQAEQTISKADVGDNYIDQTTEKGNVVRWQLSSMPLKVYIEPNPRKVNTFQNSFIASSKKGIEKWATGTKGKIGFTYVDSPENADIKITWRTMLDSKLTGSEAGTAYTAGVTSPEYGEDYLSAMSIILTTTDPNGKPHVPEDIEKVACHEMGHALGIMGHSKKETDMMYSGGKEIKELSERDINTINLLYELDPDISNARGSMKDDIASDKGSESPSNDSNSKVLGSKKERLQREIDQIETAIKQNPKSDINHVNLGNLYGDKGDFDKAIREYKKAITLNPKNDVAFSNLGSMYQAANKPYDALRAYSDARRLSPDKPKPYLQIAFLSADLNQKAEAMESLKQYLNLNPKGAEDKDVQALAKKLGLSISTYKK